MKGGEGERTSRERRVERKRRGREERLKNSNKTGAWKGRQCTSNVSEGDSRSLLWRN